MSAIQRLTALGMLMIGLTIPLTSVPGFQSVLSFGGETECGCESELADGTTRSVGRRSPRHANLRLFFNRTECDSRKITDARGLVGFVCLTNSTRSGHCDAGHRHRSGSLAPLRC